MLYEDGRRHLKMVVENFCKKRLLKKSEMFETANPTCQSLALRSLKGSQFLGKVLGVKTRLIHFYPSCTCDNIVSSWLCVFPQQYVCVFLTGICGSAKSLVKNLGLLLTKYLAADMPDS